MKCFVLSLVAAVVLMFGFAQEVKADYNWTDVEAYIDSAMYDCVAPAEAEYSWTYDRGYWYTFDQADSGLGPNAWGDCADLIYVYYFLSPWSQSTWNAYNTAGYSSYWAGYYSIKYGNEYAAYKSMQANIQAAYDANNYASDDKFNEGYDAMQLVYASAQAYADAAVADSLSLISYNTAVNNYFDDAEVHWNYIYGYFVSGFPCTHFTY